MTLEEISLIYHYECEKGSTREMCRDYWLFLYLANGVNIKDFCLLKWKNVEGKMISFIREKTKRTKKDVVMIRIVTQPEMTDIMNRWANLNKSKDAYIFPHLPNDLSPMRLRTAVDLVGRLINDNMKAIAKEVGIQKPVRTYEALGIRLPQY